MRSYPTFRNPYLRLMRLHQPVGFWLCYWPSAWALLLAEQSIHWGLLALFLAGAVLVRGAGCIANDMIDRDFDKHVARTKDRPLASGELSVKQALIFLGILLKIAFLVLVAVYVHMPADTTFTTLFAIALPVPLLSAAYPFMKRITWWPQAFLGFTFNWGVFIGWVAVRGVLEWPAFVLYLAAMCWTLGYDTVYGYQDLKDDEKIGVKSTSRLMQGREKQWIGGFYAATLGLLLIAVLGSESRYTTGFLLGLAVMAAQFFWQVRHLDANDPAACLRLFKSNAWIGGLWLLPAFLLETL